MMLETAYVLAGVALVSLILAVAVAVSPVGRLQLRRLSGASTPAGRHLLTASHLLMAAVALSGIAALLAITAFFAN